MVEKLGIRCEGVAVGYLQINGQWEDHMQFAITVEEWNERGAALCDEWLGGLAPSCATKYSGLHRGEPGLELRLLQRPQLIDELPLEGIGVVLDVGHVVDRGLEACHQVGVSAAAALRRAWTAVSSRSSSGTHR